MILGRKLFKSMLQAKPKWKVTIEYQGVSFVENFDVRDGDFNRIFVENYVHKLLGVNKLYEKETFDFIREHLSERGVFIDVGANMGVFSRYARHYRESATIIAFEPNNELWLRRKNLLAGENINFFNFAVGEKQSISYFEIDKKNLCHSKISKSGQKVEVIPLGKFMCFAYPEIDRIDAIKIDVEGYEVEVLKGCAHLLEKNKIGAICIETNEHTEKKVEEILVGAGYKKVLEKDKKVGNEVWIIKK
jgi:FkbM family methyltransferase